MTKIAFVTMSYNDDFFLKRWVNYYSQWVPREQLYVILHGLEHDVATWLHGCQIIKIPRVEIYENWDSDRWHFLSLFSSSLTYSFDWVVTNDVDELITVHPENSQNIVEYLEQQPISATITPFALEVIHRSDLEPNAFDENRGILEQRSYVRFNATYCKPCIISEPIDWNVGGHYSSCPTLNLSDNLFLFHLSYFDRDRLVNRQKSLSESFNKLNPKQVKRFAGPSFLATSGKMEKLMDQFNASGPPEDRDIQFSHVRKIIREGFSWSEKQGYYTHPKRRRLKTYKLPKAFSKLL